MKIEITGIEPIRVQSDNKERLDVSYKVIDGKEVVAERRENFPLETSKEEINETLKKALNTFREEKSQAEAEATELAANKELNKTKKSLEGSIIS